jgi:hypothetical protein
MAPTPNESKIITPAAPVPGHPQSPPVPLPKEHGEIPKDGPDNEAETYESQMEAWWDQSVSTNLKLPEGYQHVAVLIIQWDEEIDQLEVAREVSHKSYQFWRYEADI